MAENQEELKSLLMRVKQETERAGLKLNIKKTKIKVSGPVQFSSVQLLVVSDYLQPYGLLHANPPCQSLISRVCSNSCTSSRWCHPIISSSVVPFSCPQSCPSSESFSMSQFLASGGQSIGASASASVLPMNIQDWFPFGFDWFDLLVAQGTLKNLLQHYSSKTSFPIASCQIEGGNVEEVTNFLFLVSKITADGDWSHKIRCLLLGRKTVTNVDSVLKSGDITLVTKVHVVKAMVFPVVIYVVRTGP